MSEKTLKISIVGSCYRSGVNWKNVENGAKLELVPEPDNESDENAVAVFVNGEKIGYLPREKAAVFSPLIRNKYVTVNAQVMEVDSWVERRRHSPIIMLCKVDKNIKRKHFTFSAKTMVSSCKKKACEKTYKNGFRKISGGGAKSSFSGSLRRFVSKAYKGEVNVSEEIKIPEGLDQSIAEFLEKQNYQNRMCIRNVNTLADTLSQHKEVVTSEVFFEILSRLGKTDISQLPDIYAVRNAVTALLQGSGFTPSAIPVTPISTPKNEPVLAFAGTAPVQETFPVQETSFFQSKTTVVPEGTPTPKRLGGVGKSPVLATVSDITPPKSDTFVEAAEALLTAPPEVKTQLEEMVEDVLSDLPFDLDDGDASKVIEAQFTNVESEFEDQAVCIPAAAPKVVAAVEAAPAVETSGASEEPSDSTKTVEESADSATEKPRKSRKVAAAADADEVVKKLLAIIDAKDTKIKQLEKSLQEATESSQVKLSRSSVERLSELGIVV